MKKGSRRQIPLDMPRCLFSGARSFVLVALLAAPIAALAGARGDARTDATGVRMLIYNAAFLPWIMLWYLKQPGGLAFWRRRRNVFSKSFREYVDARIPEQAA
jgi:hypothetical protein